MRLFSTVLKPSVPLFFFYKKNPEAALICLAAATSSTPSFPPLSSSPVSLCVFFFFKGRLAAIHPATEQAAEFSRRAARRDLEVEISSDVACVLKKEKSNEENKEKKFFGGGWKLRKTRPRALTDSILLQASLAFRSSSLVS